MKAGARGRIWAFWGIFLLASLALSLAGVEVSLRVSKDLFRRLYYIVYEPAMFRNSEWTPWTLRENVNDVHVRRGEFRATIRSNAQGLREDRLIAVPKPKDVFRVVTLGDSFAFGFGVNREKLFQAELERLLSKRVGSKRVEVINMGYASAYSPDSAYVYLKQFGMSYEPDLILHIFCYSNDIGNILENFKASDYDSSGLPVHVRYFPVMIDPESGQRTNRIAAENRAQWRMLETGAPYLPFHGPADENFRGSRLKLLYDRHEELEHLRAANGGELRENSLLLPGQPEPLNDLYVDSPFPGAPPDQFITPSWAKGWEIGKRIFTGMKTLADTAHVPFAVVLVPTAFLVEYDPRDAATSVYSKFYRSGDLEEAVRLNKPARIFGNAFRAAHIDWFDPTPEMRAGRTSPLYFKYDAHWNEQGHAKLGAILDRWISTQGWVR